MHPQTNFERAASELLESQGLTLVSCKVLQTLWAGYGHVCSVQGVSQKTPTEKPLSLVLKHVSPPVKSARRQDEGHLRKVVSYQVEQYFYTHLAPSLPKNVAVASCLASVDAHDASSNTTAMVLTDLRQEFSVAGEKRGELNRTQVHAAVDWLAGFHGFWWTRGRDLRRDKLRLPPLQEIKISAAGNRSNPASTRGSVWLNGGYTYLATRRTEYNSLAEDDGNEWAEKLCTALHPDSETLAERVARFLAPSLDQSSEYETLLHGDVKSENLFTTSEGDAVAFFDFQYVGLGFGVCDLAKLFTCSVPADLLYDGATDGMMHAEEEKLLHRYLKQLEVASGKAYSWEIFVRHWEVALVDWLRFQASWGFWGNTEWLEARVRTIVEDDEWRTWLQDNVASF